MNRRRPLVSEARIAAVLDAFITDENGARRPVKIAGEYPLTLYVDKREIVTLMTLGQMPEALVIGWLRNQRLIDALEDIEEVRVDWEVNAAAVYTRNAAVKPPADARVTITSGCGQGTMFNRLMEEMEDLKFIRRRKFGAPALFDLLAQIRARETIYKQAGAVHACALAEYGGGGARVLLFVEDIGRHNAIDAIAGWMWLNNVDGGGKVFYTTGRLTSEMVIKCAQMRVPYLVSRSGTTRMGYEFAGAAGITMIGRALNRRYSILSGEEHFNRAAK